MSNCHVRELNTLYLHLFEDAKAAFPNLAVEFDRDVARLQKYVDRNGIKVYLETLPDIGKHFDRCLSNGEYIPSGLPLTKRFSGGVVCPKFLRGLLLLIFDATGALKEDPSIEAILFVRQILFAAKKANYQCETQRVLDAVEEFFEVDASLPIPESMWRGRSVPSFDELKLLAKAPLANFAKHPFIQWRLERYGHLQPDLQLFLVNLDVVSKIICATLGHYDPSEWRFRHGPGAISQVTGPSNKYHWYTWTSRLESAYPIADYGYYNYSSWSNSVRTPMKEAIPFSRLIAVPKTYKTPRLIAAEPSEHQWCQQNCLHYLATKMDRSWIGDFIRLTDQGHNRELCRQGSVDDTLATVDLSAASDRVSCLVVQLMFGHNPSLMQALLATRTQYVSQNIHNGCPDLYELRKFSTMGSALTFPIESLVFLAIVLAAEAASHGVRVQRSQDLLAYSGSVSVFGDDLIVSADTGELLIAALELLWFKVNVDKSFFTGKFRESCGLDSFDGCDITPVYWKRSFDGSPESLASVIETRNNFYKKWLMSTSDYLASTLPRNVLHVSEGSGVSGLKSRVDPDLTGYKTRWNEDLQRTEVFGVQIFSKQMKTPTNDDSAILQYFTEAPSPTTQWSHGVAQRPAVKARGRWVPVSDCGVESQ